MLRRYICLLLAAGVVLLMPGVVKGAEQTGTVQVIPVWGEEAIPGGRVSLFRIGTETEEGIRVTDGLANWTLQEGEVLSRDWLQWILQGSTAGQMVTAAAEGAVFSELEEGVYLVQQEEACSGFSVFQPFLVPIPDGENWSVIRKPILTRTVESPRTGDRPAPIIGAMGIGFSVAALMVLMDGRKK